MSVRVDAKEWYSVDTGGTTTTISLNVGSAADRTVFVYVRANLTITGVSVGGEAMTLLQSGADPVAYAYAGYSKKVIGTGLLDVVVTFGATGGARTIECVSYSGANDVRNSASSSGSAAGMGVTLITVAGDICVMLGRHIFGGRSFTPTSPATGFGTAADSVARVERVATTASTNIAGTWPDADGYSGVGISLVDAPAGVNLAGNAAATSTASAAFPGTQNLAGSAAAQATASAGFYIPTLTSGALKNNTNTVLASTVIPKVVVLKLLDMTMVLSLTNLTTNASGQLVITNAALNLADYLIVASNATGSAIGIYKAAAV